MRKIILLLLISINAYCQTYAVISSTNLGGNGTDDVNKAIKTADGNIVFIGTTTSNTGDFATNHGGKDIFIRKVSLSGTILWTKLYGGSADDEGVDIVEESNGDLTFIANFNSGNGDISVPPQPNYGEQTPGYWICRINSTASSIISQTQSFSYNNYSGSLKTIYAFAKSATGDNVTIVRGATPVSGCSTSYFQGVWFNNTSFCNGVLGGTTFNKMIRLSNGDYVAIGFLYGATGDYNQPYGSIQSWAGNDIYVVRFTSQGTVVWKKFFGGTNHDYGMDIKEHNGHLYLVGNTTSNDYDLTSNAGSTDVFIAKLDLDGNKLASTTFASTDRDIANVLKISNTGTLLVGGFTGGSKIKFIEYDVNFTILRQFENFNPFNGYAIRDIIENGTDIYFLSETSQRGQDGGGSTVGSDIFLLKYSQCTPQTVAITPTTQTINLGQTATYIATFTGTPPYGLTHPGGGSYLSFTTNTINFTWTPTTTGTFNFTPTITTCGNLQGNQITLIVNNVPPIAVGTISPTNLCYGSNISVPFTTTLPSGTTYTVKLKKGTTTYQTTTGTTSPISIQVPYSNSLGYGTDYFVEVSSGTNVSSPSNALTVGVINSSSIIDVNGNNYYGSTICNGSSLYILAKGSGYGGNAEPSTLTYKWYKNNVLLPSETNVSLLVNSVGSYYVVISQGSCSYSSSSVYIGFSSTINGSSNTYSGELTACAGTSKRIQNNYMTNQTTFQWYKDNTVISGATNRIFNATESGLYNVKITDGACIAYSPQTRFTFANGIPIGLYVQNNDTTICGNQSKYLQGTSFDNNLTYQFSWQKNGVDISNATQNYYYPYQAGKYRLKVTQGACVSYSKEKEIIVSTKVQKPKITAPYTSICTGSVYMTTDIYQGYWYKDGVKINNNYYTNYYASASGTYKMIAADGTSCQNESNEIALQFGQLSKPKIRAGGDIKNLCGSGDIISLYFDYGNFSGSFTFQWKKDGVNISGATNSYYYATTLGEYTLSATNGSCTSLSDPFVITQATTPILKIVSSDNDLLCSNRITKLTLNGLRYQGGYGTIIWQKDGVTIPNETSDQLFATAAGIYTASTNSNGCVGTSTPYEIKSGPPTGFIADPIGVVNTGNTASINISNCVGDVKWYDVATGGSSISSANPFITPVLSQNTSYWVTCTKEYCESARVQVNIIVENPCPTEIIHNNTVTSKEYITSGSIQSITDLPTGVKYNAKTFIMLSPGFQVGSNEVFEAVIGGCTSTPVIPTNGSILHLPFNGNANDESGNNNNGSVSGATLGIDRFGVANKAYRFNEGNNITVPNSASLALTNAFTYSVWVNMQSTLGKDGNGQDSNTPQQCIFTKNCDYGQLRSAINPQLDGSFILQTYANDGDQATIPFQLNQWKHIVSTYDGTTLKQYVDGVLVSTKTVTLNLTPSNSYNLIIGNMGCYVYYFNGLLDEFRIYNRGLSDTEVLNIYNAEKP